MNALLLCLPLVAPSVVQDAPAQAELHPPTSDFLLVVPDVQAIVQDYGQAPLLKTLRDERVQALLADLDLDLEGDHRALLKTWLDSLHPGAGALLDELRSFSISVGYAGGEDDPFSPEIVATFSAPEHALAAQALALSSGTLVGPEATPGLTGTQRFTSDEMKGTELWCATAGARFALGGGAVTPADFAARLAAMEAGSNANQLLSAAAAIFGAGSGPTVAWLYQARSPLEIVRDNQEARSMIGGAMDSLPSYLDPFDGRRVLRMQLRGSRFVTEMFTTGGPGGGALGGEPIQEAWLARVPPTAMLAYSTAVDGAELAPRLRELLSLVAGAMPAETTAGMTDFAPALIDVLDDLGPGMALYMFPVAGIGAPQTHAWFDVADAAAFTNEMTGLVEKLAETRPGFSSRTRPYKVKNRETGERQPFDITTITLPQESLGMAGMLAISPSFTTVDGKILFSLSSMHVKRELKRLYSGEEEAAGNPWKLHGFAVPEGARSVVFMDWGMQIEAAIGLVRALGSMAGDELPFDLSALPDARTFTQHLRPTFHVSRDVEGGTYRYHEASFGPETWIGILSALGRAGASAPISPGSTLEDSGDGG